MILQQSNFSVIELKLRSVQTFAARASVLLDDLDIARANDIAEMAAFAGLRYLTRFWQLENISIGFAFVESKRMNVIYGRTFGRRPVSYASHVEETS